MDTNDETGRRITEDELEGALYSALDTSEEGGHVQKTEKGLVIIDGYFDLKKVARALQSVFS